MQYSLLGKCPKNPPTPLGLRHKTLTATLASFAPESPQDFPARPRPNQATQQGYKYQYNDYGGKSFEKALDEHTAQSAEWNNALGYNMNDYGARNYDASIGRWRNADPMAQLMAKYSPYVYSFNSPFVVWTQMG